MALIQYITKKRKKESLSLQDLNIIKQQVAAIAETDDQDDRLHAVFHPDAFNRCLETLGHMQYEFERVGVMVAPPPSTSVPGIIPLGYSLCHKTDRFDNLRIRIDRHYDYFDPDPGLGRTIAIARGSKWAQAEGTKVEECVKSIPVTIKKDLYQFMVRSLKYYKGDKLAEWADLFMRVYDDQRRDR